MNGSGGVASSGVGRNIAHSDCRVVIESSCSVRNCVTTVYSPYPTVW